MNLYKFKRSTGYEDYIVAESYKECEKLLNTPDSYPITEIKLISSNITVQNELQND